MKSKVTLFFFFIFLNFNNAQNAFFSQSHLSPITLNPATAGTDCNNRVILNYRSQWEQALGENKYHTLSASYDTPILLNNGDRIGLGGQFLVEKAGSSQLRNSKASLALSYQKAILKQSNHQHFLIGGLQLGLAHKILLDFENLRWGSQFDGNGGFDPTIEVEDNGFRDRYFYGDISAGLAWKTTFTNNNNILLGLGIQHLNRPNQAFFASGGSSSQLNIRYIVHGLANFNLSSSFDLVPRFVINADGPSFYSDVSSGIRFSFGDPDHEAFELGAGLRLSNNYQQKTRVSSILLNANYEFNQFLIGANIDLDQSAIRTATNGFGALEIVMMYKLCNRS